MVYTLRQGDRKTEGIFFKHTVFDLHDYMPIRQGKDTSPFSAFEVGGTVCKHMDFWNGRSLSFQSRTLGYLWVGKCCLLKLYCLHGVWKERVYCADTEGEPLSQCAGHSAVYQDNCLLSFTGGRTSVMINFTIWGLLIVHLYTLYCFPWLSLMLLLFLWSFAHETSLKWMGLKNIVNWSSLHQI